MNEFVPFFVHATNCVTTGSCGGCYVAMTDCRPTARFVVVASWLVGCVEAVGSFNVVVVGDIVCVVDPGGIVSNVDVPFVGIDPSVPLPRFTETDDRELE